MSVPATRRSTPWTSPALRPTVGATANMLVAPGAFPTSGDASGRVSAACADRLDLEWVPDHEEQLVPEGQVQLCRACPIRAGCLLNAVSTGSEGYWAGTTTADRRRLVDDGPLTPAAAEELRSSVEAEIELKRAGAEVALHEPGAGSMTWYGRHGCRCTECRRANSEKRAAQRTRRRHRLQAAPCRRDAA